MTLSYVSIPNVRQLVNKFHHGCEPAHKNTIQRCLVQVLKHLVTRPAIRQPGPSSCVCFNPYLPNEKDRQQEQQRLAAKLETGIVAGIYLQMGSDLSKLESGLQHLQAQLQRLPQAGTQPVPIHGSVFIPNKRQASARVLRRQIGSGLSMHMRLLWSWYYSASTGWAGDIVLHAL